MKIFNLFKRRPKKLKRYYREWIACHGWGVMLYYDTYWATSKREAAKGEPVSAYVSREYSQRSWKGYYETVVKVMNEHEKLSDDELSKIYGQKENE